MQQQLIINNNNATMIHLLLTPLLLRYHTFIQTNEPVTICVNFSCPNPPVSNTNATSHYITFIFPLHSFLFFPFLSFPFLSFLDDHQTIETRQSNLVLCIYIIIIIINNATTINNAMQFLCYI